MEISRTENWKGRGYTSIMVAAPVTIAGETTYVAAVIDQNPNNKFYLSEIVDAEGNYVRITESPIDHTKSGVTVQDGITAGAEGLSEGSISQTSQNSQAGNGDGLGAADAGFNKDAGPQVQTQNKTVMDGVVYSTSNGITRPVAQGDDLLSQLLFGTQQQNGKPRDDVLVRAVRGELTPPGAQYGNSLVNVDPFVQEVLRQQVTSKTSGADVAIDLSTQYNDDTLVSKSKLKKDTIRYAYPLQTVPVRSRGSGRLFSANI